MNIGYDDKHCRLVTQIIWILKVINCGSHSGFPPCCILHFIYCHVINNKYKNKYYKKYDRLCPPWVEYRPCPICIKSGYFVECKPCPDDGWCFGAQLHRKHKMGN